MTITMTEQKLRTFIHTAVRQELQELFSDPDFGLSLQPAVERRLLRATKARAPRLLRSADQIINRLKLAV